MRSTVLLVCMLCGCGRLGFGDNADRPDGAVGDGGDASTDATDAASDGPMAMAQLVQTSPIVDAAGSQTLTLADPSAAGSLLVITFGANSIASLGLPAGWIIAAQSPTGACTAAIAYLPNNPGGISSVMFTQPQLLPTVAQLTEWTGMASSPLDAIGSIDSQVAETMQTVQTATPTTASNDLAIDVFCQDINNPTYTGDPAWISLGTVTNGPSEPSFSSDYRFVTTPGVVSTQVGSSNPGKYSAAIATFRSK